jgi:hypothetical protein
MLTWIQHNAATLIALLVVAVIAGLAARSIRKDKLAGSKCAGCPYAAGCTQGRTPPDNSPCTDTTPLKH